MRRPSAFLIVAGLVVASGAAVLWAPDRASALFRRVVGAAPAAAPAAPMALPLLFRGRIEPVGGIHQVGAHGAAPTEILGTLEVVEGDAVTAGQVVARLASQSMAERALAAAEAAVAVAERRLDNVRRPFKDAELESLRAMARARAAEVDLADRQQRRSETLQSRGVASVVDQDIRMTEVRTARARLREAEANLAAIEQVSATRLALEEAELVHARRRAEEARAAAALTIVRAPVDGTVLAIRARAGQALVTGRILDLADLSKLKIVAEVDERFVPRVRVGQKASLRLRGDARQWPAEVRRIGSLVETAHRAPSDTVTGTDARIVEVDLVPMEADGLPRVAGLEVSVLFEP